MTPMQLARALEHRRTLPPGSAERFSGYGVIGLPFASGHVLGLRRFVASSIGPPFTTVWHRDPGGRWTFFTDVEPDRSCPRYFGPALHAVERSDIEIAWLGPHEFAVHVGRPGLHWAVRLGATPLTRAISSLAGAIPARLWRAPAVPELLGALAGRALLAGPLRLRGTAPAGRRFLVHPTRVLRVTGSAAVLGSRELGSAITCTESIALGDFLLPRCGLFAFGDAAFSDPAA